MTDQGGEIRVVPLADAWGVHYVGGKVESFASKDAALIAAQEAAMRVGLTVLVCLDENRPAD